MDFDKCDPDYCERDWPLGAKGVCNNVTLLCECPEGFDGVDDWEIFNDCHINTELRRNIRIVLVVVSVIQTLISLFAMIWLLNRKGSSLSWLIQELCLSCSSKKRQLREELNKRRLEEAKREYEMSGTFVSVNMFEDEDSLVSEGESELEREIAKQEEFAKKPNAKLKESKNETGKTVSTVTRKKEIDEELKLLRKTNARAFFMASMLFLFGVFLTYYEAAFLFLEVSSRVSLDPVQNFAGGVATGFIISGVWFLIYLWYKTLPELSLYGKLFGINEAFIKYNHLVVYIVAFFMALTFVLCVLFVFLLPILFPSKLRMYNDAALWTWSMSVLLAVLLLLFFLVMLLQLYSSSLEALDLRKRAVQNKENEERFKVEVIGGNQTQVLANLEKKEKVILRAQRLAYFAFAFGLTAELCILLLTLGNIYIEEFRRNYYLTISFMTIVASIVGIFLSVLVLVTLRKKKKEGEELSPDVSI